METDKRPRYVWMMVILINAGVLISDILYSIFSHSFFEMIYFNLVLMGISLFISVVPILISKSNGRLKNRFGYGIPILLLLPLPYFIYDYYTCTGKFCEIGPLFLGWAFGLSSIIFASFYTIGIYSQKWSPRTVLIICWIVPIFLLSTFWFITTL